MNYQKTLDYIYSFVNYETLPQMRDKAHFDLRRMEELLAHLGSPQLAGHAVHIAGTNGKGSVAAMMASVLSTSGYRVGLYTSPHLQILEERIRVNGRLISSAELINLVEKLKPEIEAVKKKATYGQLTTFEVLTALGFCYFKLKGVDFKVLEVGLGGRLDATNVVSPEVAIITSISFDHKEVLGDCLPELAREKAGIIKPKSKVVLAPQADEVTRTIEEICSSLDAELVKVGRDVTWQGSGFDLSNQSLKVQGRLSSYKLTIPLLGEHQLENTATAVAALEVLDEKGFNIPGESIINGLAKVSWPGRLEVLHHHPLLIVDSAHNPDSARKLKQAIKKYFDFDRAFLIIGTSLDKDVAAIVSELAPLFSEVIITRSRHPRAMAPPTLASEFRNYPVKVHLSENVTEALTLALSLAKEPDLVCASGSLFIAAEVTQEASKLLANKEHLL